MNVDSINTVLNILIILIFVAGLWIAAIMLPKLVAWLRPQAPERTPLRPLVTIVLWLGLSYMLTFPMRDVLTLVTDVLQIILGQSQRISVATGMVPVLVYFLFYIILMLVIYALILWVCREFFHASGPLNGAERGLLVLTAASLTYQSVQRLIASSLNYALFPQLAQLSDGSLGFIIQAVLSILVLGILVVAFYPLFFRRSEEEDDEDDEDEDGESDEGQEDTPPE
jgi:hypothetical protein